MHATIFMTGVVLLALCSLRVGANSYPHTSPSPNHIGGGKAVGNFDYYGHVSGYGTHAIQSFVLLLSSLGHCNVNPWDQCTFDSY